MQRRRFIKGLFCVIAIGGLLLVGGCGEKEESSGFGNQEALWHIVSGQQEIEEPLDLPYSKETPALYRDASMGKADPSFIPKISGG